MRTFPLLFLLLLSGCEDQIATNEQVGPISGMILKDIPRVEHYQTIHWSSRSGIEIVLENSEWKYRREGLSFEGDGDELMKFLEVNPSNDSERVVRIWAPAETKFSKMTEVIEKVARAGITEVYLAVREIDDEAVSRVLQVDIPTVSNRGREVMGFFVSINAVGEVFLRGESGVAEKLSDEELLQRIFIFDAVAESGKHGPNVWQLSVDDDVSHQRFSEVLELLRMVHSVVQVMNPFEDFSNSIE